MYGGPSMYGEAPEGGELAMLAQQEQTARERLEAARDRNLLDDGVAEHEHHALIHKLEAEWKEARERLERHQKS